MNEKEVHERLVAELFNDSLALSAREIAARNEIAALRKRLESMSDGKPFKKVSKE